MNTYPIVVSVPGLKLSITNLCTTLVFPTLVSCNQWYDMFYISRQLLHMHLHAHRDVNLLTSPRSWLGYVLYYIKRYGCEFTRFLVAVLLAMKTLRFLAYLWKVHWLTALRLMKWAKGWFQSSTFERCVLSTRKNRCMMYVKNGFKKNGNSTYPQQA